MTEGQIGVGLTLTILSPLLLAVVGVWVGFMRLGIMWVIANFNGEAL